ncbi:hypothetical protein AB1Y20_007132 [Prymnesium parvum]|uniref:Uncharacterized protein n=1 Tax=Prymnesium parvum TaxID=97485 RepID=A0AB34J2J0_PRYPA
MSVRAAAAVELRRRAHQQAYCGGQRGAVSAAPALLLRFHRTLARASGCDARPPPAATRCDSARGAAGRMSQFSNASIVTVPMVEILKKQGPTSNVYRRNTACWMRRKNTA